MSVNVYLTPVPFYIFNVLFGREGEDVSLLNWFMFLITSWSVFLEHIQKL